MKAVAHRPRDAADIEAVLDAYPKLDKARIRRWVEEFAEALEMPELYTNLDALMKRTPRQPSARKRRPPRR